MTSSTNHANSEPERQQPSAFSRMAMAVSRASGKPLVFASAVGIVVVWAIAGPMFGFSETWQLFINTTTTIITFLMVFLIQATQNRDNEAVQLKLDELIEVTREAHDDMIDLEEQSDEFIEEKRAEMKLVREKAEANGSSRTNGTSDADGP